MTKFLKSWIKKMATVHIFLHPESIVGSHAIWIHALNKNATFFVFKCGTDILYRCYFFLIHTCNDEPLLNA